MELRPFTHEMLPEAGAMLAARHAADLAAMPMIAPQYAQPQHAEAAVAALLERPHAHGVAAFAGGQLRGYMISELIFDATWGRVAWVRLAGSATAPGQGSELLRDMYAHLAMGWVDQGCYAHFATIPAADPSLLFTWSTLSFGIEHMYALLDIASLAPRDPQPGISIRRATSADRQTMAGFSDLIWRQQVQSPCWAFTAPERAAELPPLYGAEVDDPEVTLWLAFDGGQPVGVQEFCAAEETPDKLLYPAGCTELSIGGVAASHRGRGISGALLSHALREAAAQGHTTCATDWRSTNLLSSRVWPHLGFRPVAYRLTRRIDQRIVFAAR